MNEATRTKEKLDQDREDKATNQREAQALQNKMILKMLANLSPSPATA